MPSTGTTSGANAEGAGGSGLDDGVTSSGAYTVGATSSVNGASPAISLATAPRSARASRAVELVAARRRGSYAGTASSVGTGSYAGAGSYATGASSGGASYAGATVS